MELNNNNFPYSQLLIKKNKLIFSVFSVLKAKRGMKHICQQFFVLQCFYVLCFDNIVLFIFPYPTLFLGGGGLALVLAAALNTFFMSFLNGSSYRSVYEKVSCASSQPKISLSR